MICWRWGKRNVETSRILDYVIFDRPSFLRCNQILLLAMLIVHSLYLFYMRLYLNEMTLWITVDILFRHFDCVLCNGWKFFISLCSFLVPTLVYKGLIFYIIIWFQHTGNMRCIFPSISSFIQVSVMICAMVSLYSFFVLFLLLHVKNSIFCL